jgi:uncharacterized ferredoxin-like protein
MGDRDTDYIKRYRTAVRNGQTVIAVAAKDDDTRGRASEAAPQTGEAYPAV